MINIGKHFIDISTNILIVVLTIILIFVLVEIISKTEKDNDIIIKNAEVNIDNNIKTNDSIKLEIENINKIKDAEIIEVRSLDNDSTVKLFYKLVKE
jgi:hypothetical protein|nr:MAG TPA: hypothetical protein [Crassvirales sp.]